MSCNSGGGRPCWGRTASRPAPNTEMEQRSVVMPDDRKPLNKSGGPFGRNAARAGVINCSVFGNTRGLQACSALVGRRIMKTQLKWWGSGMGSYVSHRLEFRHTITIPRLVSAAGLGSLAVIRPIETKPTNGALPPTPGTPSALCRHGNEMEPKLFTW